jgi:hypothetical protein
MLILDTLRPFFGFVDGVLMKLKLLAARRRGGDGGGGAYGSYSSMRGAEQVRRESMVGVRREMQTKGCFGCGTY